MVARERRLVEGQIGEDSLRIPWQGDGEMTDA